MKHIIPEVNIISGKHCYYSSIFNILAYHGFEISEAEIFVLFGGFIIRYDCNKGTLNLTMYDEMPFEYAKKITSGVRYIKDPDKSKEFEEIFNAIDNNQLVLVTIQNKFLSYNRVYQESESYLHYIIMYGYDMDAGVAYIADTFMLDHSGKALTYSGTVPLDDIIEGIVAYACFDIKDNNIMPAKGFIDLFLEQFKTFLYNGSGPDIYIGNQAIRKYIENIFPSGEMDVKNFEKSCLNAIYNLKFGVLLHLLEYLIGILEKYGRLNDEAEELLIRLKSLKADWHSYFIHLLKVAYSGKKGKANETIRLGLDIFDKQERVFIEILSSLSKSNKTDVVDNIEGSLFTSKF